MRITEIDNIWFNAHPGREYRLRRQTRAELARWPVQPDPTDIAWCIIRAEDGAVEVFASDATATWCDCDGCLEDLFRDIRGEAAA